MAETKVTKNELSISSLIDTFYPVGSIYTATVSTNPGTLFGFGTWAAFGEGRVLVGKASSGTFATAGATGGAETHTLTTSEMPSHTHKITTYFTNTGNGTYIASANGSIVTGEGGPTQATGGGGSHNNLQPYVVVYMWQRTA